MARRLGKEGKGQRATHWGRAMIRPRLRGLLVGTNFPESATPAAEMREETENRD
jgi:hypothetical protein